MKKLILILVFVVSVIGWFSCDNTIGPEEEKIKRKANYIWNKTIHEKIIFTLELKNFKHDTISGFFFNEEDKKFWFVNNKIVKTNHYKNDFIVCRWFCNRFSWYKNSDIYLTISGKKYLIDKFID